MGYRLQSLGLICLLLLLSCGRKAKLEVVQTAPGEYLIVDRNCVAVVRKREMRGGQYILKESDGYCNDTNITLQQHISDAYSMEGVFEDGELVYIWPEESMDKLMEYLIRNGQTVGGGENDQ